MSEGLRRLFRSCWSLIPVLMVTGALVASAQTPQTSKDGDSPLLAEGERQAPVSAPMSDAAGNAAPSSVQFRLAMQIDTVLPGQRDFLEPNAPNPFGLFSETTRMAFTISQPSRVELRVYDFFYNEVITLIEGDLPSGRHVMQFRPPPTMPTGMYFYELKTDHFRDLRRMIYIK